MIRFWTKEDQEYWNKPEHQLMFEWDLLWTSENIWDRTEEHTKLRKEKLIDLFKRFIDAVMKANPVVNRVSPLKVYVVEGYDSIFDTDEIKKIFSTRQRALDWMKENNYGGEPSEYEVI